VTSAGTATTAAIAAERLSEVGVIIRRIAASVDVVQREGSADLVLVVLLVIVIVMRGGTRKVVVVGHGP
jgi:hypothetical protein